MAARVQTVQDPVHTGFLRAGAALPLREGGRSRLAAVTAKAYAVV